MATIFDRCYAAPVARSSTAPIFPSIPPTSETDISPGSYCAAADTGMALGCASGGRSGALAPVRAFGPFSPRTIRARPSARSGDQVRRCIRVGIAAGLALELAARPASAQDVLSDRMQLDRIQLVSLGAGAGSIAPSQVDPTSVFVLSSDYGEISPAWRVLFRISYWESKFKNSVVQAFVDTLQSNLVNPTATTIRPSDVTLYDATFAIGARRLLIPRAAITPFFSGAMAELAHVPVLAKMRGLQLAGVCDNARPRARALADRFGIPDAMTDIEDLLELDELNAVVIATPNHLHEPHVLSALAAGVDVLSERPLALSARGVERILSPANRSGRKGAVGNNPRFRTTVQALARSIHGAG